MVLCCDVSLWALAGNCLLVTSILSPKWHHCLSQSVTYKGNCSLLTAMFQAHSDVTYYPQGTARRSRHDLNPYTDVIAFVRA